MALIQSVENASPGFVNSLSIEVSISDQRQVKELVEDFEEFFRLFENRSREYGDHAFVLGSRGQFADMNRKMGKFKTAVWDGDHEALTSEGIHEVIMDMIGHCFLTLQCLRREGVGQKAIRGSSVNLGRGVTGHLEMNENGFNHVYADGSRRPVFGGDVEVTDGSGPDAQTETDKPLDPRTPAQRLAEAEEELRSAQSAVRAANYAQRQESAKRKGRN